MEEVIRKLIDDKRKELLAQVKEECNAAIKRAEEGANALANAFANTLKEACDLKIVGPSDILRVLEKGGVVYREVIDLRKARYSSGIGVRELLNNIAGGYTGFTANWQYSEKHLEGVQRVTIIIEPVDVEGEKNESK